MSNVSTTLSLAVHDIENEPRILDTDLAKALGIERATNIRTRIKGMWADLEALGRVALVEETLRIAAQAETEALKPVAAVGA